MVEDEHVNTVSLQKARRIAQRGRVGKACQSHEECAAGPKIDNFRTSLPHENLNAVGGPFQVC